MTGSRRSLAAALRVLVPLLAASIACARAPAVFDVPAPPVCRDVVSLTDARPPNIVWVEPDDERDRARLTAWCAMVGPILYDPEPDRARLRSRNGTADFGEAAAPSLSIDRVAVVSWNTHVGGGDLDALVDAVQRGDFTRGERFEAIVLLLQEMYRHGGGVPERATIRSAIPKRIVDAFHTGHTRDVRRVARERGLAVLYAPSMRNGLAPEDPEDRGNAILSTLTLFDPVAIELPLERQRRVVPVAAVGGRTATNGSWRLRLANVHLDTALAPLHGGPLAARRRQADALAVALTRALRFEGPTVLAGDFNTWLGEREPAIRQLRGAFPDAPRIRGATWAGPLGIHATLDYVFARGNVEMIQVQRLPSRFGSDHYPLLAVIRF